MAEEKIKCSKCGVTNDKDSSFCQGCGNPLEKDEVCSKKTNKKALSFPLAIEITLFLIFALIITAFPLYEIKVLMKDIVNQKSYSAFQQIFEASFISGEAIAIVMGILIAFILWVVFKFNRLEKRIIELQEKLNKE